ncbi:glycosyltransferase family 9 protein [bacterium]|nr:glycosyltransferase family 9 protein [FCB group bacterium]MBL7190809.1 glycosyltransferase family 9 protein [bacterium]
MNRTAVKIDCRHFRGDIPCKPHKKENVHCADCWYYDKVEEEILLIKLGARGDVIRSTPLYRRLKEEYPHSRIHWLTHFSDVLPDTIDKIYRFTIEDILRLETVIFDIAVNLDKDPEACALMKRVKAETKFGYTLKRSVPVPVNYLARPKWETGLFDDVNRANTLSYPQEIFYLMGLEFRGERYLMPEIDKRFDLNLKPPVIGLNTGGGGRWPARIWSEERFTELTSKLINHNYSVLLLGGPDEDARNERVAQSTGAHYPGFFPLREFFSLVNCCDLMVTGVTMALHIAIGLEKKIVLLNAIFNRYEFELYGLGEILEPKVDCLGCFKPVCEKDCINLIQPETVFTVIEELLS